MKENNGYNMQLNNSINAFLNNASKVICRNPAMTKVILKAIFWQKKAAQKWDKREWVKSLLQKE